MASIQVSDRIVEINNLVINNDETIKIFNEIDEVTESSS